MMRLRMLLPTVLLALGLSAALPSPAAARTACTTQALCNADVLAPFFAKLPRARIGMPGRAVHILQLGDSHTAGDNITGGWRELLQAQWGSGGRGVLPPGRPYNGYLTRGVTVAMSGGWHVSSIFGAGSAEPRGPIGLAGFALTSTASDARIAITADPGEMFDRAVICGIAEPDAGTLVVRFAEEERRIVFGSANERPECVSLTAPAAQSTLEVATEGGPVRITSWATFRDAGGVALSNLGVVGAQLVHFGRTDDAVIAEELRSYRPDLIVIAFGTNEGFTPAFSAFSYEATLRTQIGRIRRLAGNVPILLLGAPDALSRQPGLRANAPGAAIACGPVPRPAPLPAPLPRPADPLAETIAGLAAQARVEGAEIADAPASAAAPPMMASATAAAPSRAPLFAPPALAAVREVQRRIADQLGVAYWDWQGRMGGACAAQRWVFGSPPRMRGDYVHFNAAGGRDIARALQADLSAAASGGR